MAASQMRLYIIALKFWPKVQLVHAWNCDPILDIDFTPRSFIFSAIDQRDFDNEPIKLRGYRIDRHAVDKGGKIDLALRPCGGYCARIVRVE